VRRKDRPTPEKAPDSAEAHPAAGGAPVRDTAERLAAIVEAAERAAVSVIDDAEAEARRRLEEAEAEAERLVAERLASISDPTESLLAQAEEIRDRTERLIAALEQASGERDGEPGPGRADRSQRPSHLSAVGPAEEPGPPALAELSSSSDERPTPAGARLLATQMAVSGSSRKEIEARLRNGFEIEDTASILDAILGPED
jgi:vacuolar-type H+-ATPase subunit H